MSQNRRTKPSLQEKAADLRREWKRIRQRVFSVAMWILGAIPITLLFGSVGLFRELETPLLDVQSRARSARSGEDQIVIVRITHDDYQSIFQGKSPLDPAGLRRVIDSIARSRPKVIGVDIDTASAEFRDFQVAPDWPPVVWARDAIYSNTLNKYRPLDVLGSKAPPPLSGLVAYQMDKDEAVRRYSRMYDTEAGLAPSFPFAIARAFSPEGARMLKESKDDLLINYVERPARFSVPASHVLALNENASWMAGKIVLIGGDYAVQDEHDTPLGWQLGVEILAQIVETELEGGGLKVPGKTRVIFIAVTASFVLWSLLAVWRPRYLVLTGLIIIVMTALACSLIAYRSMSQWGYFLPILIAVLIQQSIERLNEMRDATP